MDAIQITAVIGSAASLICTLVVGALAYFIKKTLTALEESDQRNAQAIRKEEEKREQEIKDLTGQLNDLKSDLPLVFTLREDFIRSVNGLEQNINTLSQKTERSIGELSQKMDRLLSMAASAGKDR